ncbi:MAG: site-specific integrase, partial [Candidatus Electrothrix sp. AR3]|nr:site-specific integrase [Candidatus Electrothrix sp. AR3]
GLRVSPKGKKTWFILYRNQQKKVKRFTLGTYPAMSLKEATKTANSFFVAIDNGADPLEDKKRAVIKELAAPTMSDLWQEYQKSLARQKKPKAASTVKGEIRRWETEIKPIFGTMNVADVERKHIAKLLNGIADKAPVSANRLHSLLSVVFKTALDLGWSDSHPMFMMKKPGGSEPARKRFLTDAEIKTIWPFFDELSHNMRDILKLILLTAQRPGEVMAMQWQNVHLEQGVWTLKDTKNGSAHLVPLAAEVKKILQARQKGEGYSNKQQWMLTSPFVFPSQYNANSKGHTTTTKKARQAIYISSGVSGWTAHDLRRTARTIMSRLQIKQHIRERVLNHSQQGVVGVYDQYDYLQEKTDAMDKLAREIMRIIGRTEPAQVVELRRLAS